MTYAISDPHGEYYKFIAMLKLIEFKEEDILYVLGDVIDRGKYPIRLLLYIIDHPNIIMLLGNHELAMIHSSNDEYYNFWMQYGGKVTLNQYSGLSKKNQNKIDTYLRNLPIIITLDNYILVHAGINSYRMDDEFCLWAKEEFLSYGVGLDKTVIFGHTPTCFITGNQNMKIWYDEGRIGIDCGACFKGGKLACLRLDDMKEFYI